MEGCGVTIPQDIMATARTVADRDVNFGSYEINTLAIARAILAERQRCADVVEDYCSDMPDLAGHGHSIGLKDAILAGEAA